jgi:hypothetical protein
MVLSLLFGATKTVFNIFLDFFKVFSAHTFFFPYHWQAACRKAASSAKARSASREACAGDWRCEVMCQKLHISHQ